MFGALRALESLSQMLRRRRLPPDSALEAAVPPEAAWPAEDEDSADADAPEGQQQQVQLRGKKKRDRTVLLVEEMDIYDAPRFRYR